MTPKRKRLTEMWAFFLAHLLEDIPALKDLFHIEPVALAMCTFQISNRRDRAESTNIVCLILKKVMK